MGHLKIWVVRVLVIFVFGAFCECKNSENKKFGTEVSRVGTQWYFNGPIVLLLRAGKVLKMHWRTLSNGFPKKDLQMFCSKFPMNTVMAVIATGPTVNGWLAKPGSLN